MILTAPRIDLNPASPAPEDVPGVVEDSPSMDQAIYQRLVNEKNKLKRMTNLISTNIKNMPFLQDRLT